MVTLGRHGQKLEQQTHKEMMECSNITGLQPPCRRKKQTQWCTAVVLVAVDDHSKYNHHYAPLRLLLSCNNDVARAAGMWVSCGALCSPRGAAAQGSLAQQPGLVGNE
jgi:hypothetical protein